MTNLHVGTFSSMGFSHKENQDYIISGHNYLILSDGCSSSPHSSVGAHLLCHNIELIRPQDLSGWHAVLDNCEIICSRLNLPVDCLCATLMWAEYNQDTNLVELKWIGDGSVAIRRRDTKEISVETISFNLGAPYYLRYEIGMREQYIAEFSDLYNGDHSYFADFPNGIILRSYNMDEFDLVTVFSDGVGSFSGLSIEEVVKETLNIKGYAGDFMYRRGQAAIKKFGAEGSLPYDDFTVGVICKI